MHTKEQLLGSLSIFTATVIYGFFSILARVVGYSIPIFYQNWTREAVATLLLILMVVATKTAWKPLSPSATKWILLRTVVGSATFLTYFYCINHMPIGTTYFLFYGGTGVFGYLLGMMLFNEKLTPVKWISIMLALSGLLLIFSLNFTNTPLYLILMALAAGAGSAFWYSIVKKVTTYPVIQLTLLDNLIPIPVYIIISLSIGEQWIIPTFTPVWIASFIYGALFVITGSLVVYGFHRVEAQIGTIIMLAEVPIAIFLAFLFYKETISLTAVIGGILILSAILIPEILMLRANHKKRKNNT